MQGAENKYISNDKGYKAELEDGICSYHFRYSGQRSSLPFIYNWEERSKSSLFYFPMNTDIIFVNNS